MDVRSLVDSLIQLAHVASAVIPGAGLVEEGAKIGEKIIDVIDELKTHADPTQQPALQEARDKLADAVRTKAAATSARLRGS